MFSPEQAGPPLPKHREACDSCHKRKVRCNVQGPGACLNCQSSGRHCVFSVRDEMGRPRKARQRENNSTSKSKNTAAPLPSPAPTTADTPKPSSASSIPPAPPSAAPQHGYIDSSFQFDDTGLAAMPMPFDSTTWTLSPGTALQGMDDWERLMSGPQWPYPTATGQGFEELNKTEGYASTAASDVDFSGMDFWHGIDAYQMPRLPKMEDEGSDKTSVSTSSSRSASVASQRLTGILYDLQVQLNATVGTSTVNGTEVVNIANTLCDLISTESESPAPVDLAGDDTQVRKLFSTAIAMFALLCRSFCTGQSEGLPQRPRKISRAAAPDSAPGADAASTASRATKSMATHTGRLSQLSAMDYQLSALQLHLTSARHYPLPEFQNAREVLDHTRQSVQTALQCIMVTT